MQKKQRRLFYRLFAIISLLVSCKSKEPAEKKPEDSRFTSTAVAKSLDEPMEFKFLGDGRILFVERRGKIKVLDPASGRMDIIADIPVSIG